MRLLVALLAVLLSSSACAQNSGAAKPAPKKNQPSTTATQQASTQSGHTPQTALLDINRASKEELEKLHGIGPVMAGRIIKGRPYRAKNELVQRRIIPQATYDKIKESIIAKQ